MIKGVKVLIGFDLDYAVTYGKLERAKVVSRCADTFETHNRLMRRDVYGNYWCYDSPLARILLGAK